MQNRIKEKLAANTPAFGAQLRFASPAIAELFGHSGFDYLVIDTEHAPICLMSKKSASPATNCAIPKSSPSTTR